MYFVPRRPTFSIPNETVKRELGGLHSAKVLLYSVDFAEIEEYQTKGEWDKSAAVLAEAAQNLTINNIAYLYFWHATSNKRYCTARFHIFTSYPHFLNYYIASMKK